MAERELRSKEDFLELIEEICESKGIKKSKIEKEAGICQGMISRWRKGLYTPNLCNFMSILQFLNVRIILRTNEPEDILYEKGDETSDQDTLLISSMVKILKSDITSSEKEILCKILQAFV